MTRLEVGILGPFEARVGGHLVPVASPRQRSLLALLALRAGEVVSVEELLDQLWAGRPPAAGAASLRNHVHRVRRILGSGALETRAAGYLLRLERDALDAARFAADIEEARRLEASLRGARLRDALALWRGRALGDFALEEWAQPDAARLEELRVLALQDRIEADLELGREEDLVPELELLVRRHPLAERLWRALMLALYRSGRQAEALATYRRAHRAFVDELGIEPGPVLAELQRAILVQDPVLLDPRRGEGIVARAAALLPLGHRGRAEALNAYATALWRLGERGASTSALAQAAWEAVAAGDRSLEEVVRLQLSWQRTVVEAKSLREHLAYAERSLRTFQELGDDRGIARALFEAGRALRDLGRAADAAAAQERAAEAARRAGEIGMERLYRCLASMTYVVGPQRVEDAIRRCEQQLTSADWDGADPIFLWISLGVLYAQAGREEDGRRWLGRATETATAAGSRNDLLIASFFAALLEIAVGDDAAADRQLVEALDQAVALNDRGMRALCAAQLARLRLRNDDGEGAPKLAADALALAAADDLISRACAMQAHGLALATRKQPRAGRKYVTEAIECLNASDWSIARAEAWEDLALLERWAAKHARERTALGRALELYEVKGHVHATARVRARLDHTRTRSASTGDR